MPLPQMNFLNLGVLNRQQSTAPAIPRTLGILPGAKALKLKSVSAPGSAVLGAEVVVTFEVENTSNLPKRYQVTMEDKKPNGKIATSSSPKAIIPGKGVIKGTFKFTPAKDEEGTDTITLKVFQAPPIIATFLCDTKTITINKTAVVIPAGGAGAGAGGAGAGGNGGLQQAEPAQAQPVGGIVQSGQSGPATCGMKGMCFEIVRQ